MRKGILILCIVIGVMSCNIYKTREVICSNSLPLRSEKKSLNSSKRVLLIFEKGFKNSKLNVVYNNNIILDSILTTTTTTGYAGEVTIEKKDNHKKVILFINGIKFKLDLKNDYAIIQIEFSSENNEINANYCNGSPYYY